MRACLNYDLVLFALPFPSLLFLFHAMRAAPAGDSQCSMRAATGNTCERLFIN